MLVSFPRLEEWVFWLLFHFFDSVECNFHVFCYSFLVFDGLCPLNAGLLSVFSLIMIA